MKSKIYSGIAGILVGIVIFWAPSIFGGGDFGGVMFFSYLSEMIPSIWDHWLLPGIAYILISVIIFLLYKLFFRRKGEKFLASFYHLIFFIVGLYASLSFFFFLLGGALSRGGF